MVLLKLPLTTMGSLGVAAPGTGAADVGVSKGACSSAMLSAGRGEARASATASESSSFAVSSSPRPYTTVPATNTANLQQDKQQNAALNCNITVLVIDGLGFWHKYFAARLAIIQQVIAYA